MVTHMCVIVCLSVQNYPTFPKDHLQLGVYPNYVLINGDHNTHTHILTIIFHLLQHLHTTLLLSGVVIEHPLNKVPRHKDLFGKHIQEFVVDCDVSLHPEFRHFLQSSINELYMPTPADVLLIEGVQNSVEIGFALCISGCSLKELIVCDQGFGLFLNLMLYYFLKICTVRLALAKR